MTIEHLDPEGQQQRCPTCGQRVGTFTAADGTSFYLATAEQEASQAEFLREELSDAHILEGRFRDEIERLETLLEASHAREEALEQTITELHEGDGS